MNRGDVVSGALALAFVALTVWSLQPYGWIMNALVRHRTEACHKMYDRGLFRAGACDDDHYWRQY